MKTAFSELRNDQDFADVTLVCEDGTQIETHKVILASSSLFFMEILQRNKHPHSMIYMRGLKGEALLAMINFLYNGEANVNQESLDVFLGLAEELRLRGLTDSSAESKYEEFSNEAIPPEKNVKEGKYHVKTNPILPKPRNLSDSNIANTESSSAALLSVNTENLDKQILSKMTRTEKQMIFGNKKVKVWACDICGKEDQKENIKTHIESNHIASNISHPCGICGKISRSKTALRMHKARHHTTLFLS